MGSSLGRAAGAAATRALRVRARVERAKLERAVAAGLQIGPGWSLSGRCPSFGSEPWLVRIGRDVRFTDGVHFVTHDGGTWVLRNRFRPTHLNRYGAIEVGDNCFFGVNVIVLPDVRIGSDCVIGAGSVVASDLPDGSVAAGVPARVVSDLDSYHRKCQDETLLEKGHTVEALRVAVWERFEAQRRRP